MKLNRAFWLRWHRRIGVAAAAFLLLVAITGILLNHSRMLGLHHIYLDSPWVLSAYQMQLPDGYILNTRQVGDHVIVTTKDRLLKLAANQNIRQAVEKHYRGDGVSLEKFLLDLHSGQLAGVPGTLLSDLVALALIWLAGTGLYNVWKRRP